MRILPVFAALTALAAAPAYAASPAEGLWRTPSFNGEVLVSACDQGALCGKIVTSDRIKSDPTLTDTKNKDAGLRSRPLKDLPILKGFTGGPAEWKGGSVYNPEDGGTYKGSIKLVDADTLKLTGCIVFPLCKTQEWHRIK
ncbi:MAG TPA: DUF2147 domain-containing protein [Caulobacteraceae bacterium]|jgi:uncharacterized protein (DUF2147 family)|nr:DUF2147 domain-containing protein [Caulobacteraceae bacterium]